MRQFEVIADVDEAVQAGSILVMMEGWAPQHGDYVVLEGQGGYRCERWTAATPYRVIGVVCRRSSKLRGRHGGVDAMLTNSKHAVNLPPC